MYETPEVTDALVGAAAARSRSELDKLSGALVPQVRLMVAARLCAAPAQFHAVEEITQQALIAVTSGLDRLQDRTVAGLKAFTSGVVTHKVADFLRGRGRPGDGGRAQQSLDSTIAGLSGAEPLWTLLSASGTPPLRAAARAEQITLLFEQIGQLKPDYRAAITLAFFDQLSTKEVAERMETTRGAVSMLLMRAVKTLRRRIGGSSQAENSHDERT